MKKKRSSLLFLTFLTFLTSLGFLLSGVLSEIIAAAAPPVIAAPVITAAAAEQNQSGIMAMPTEQNYPVIMAAAAEQNQRGKNGPSSLQKVYDNANLLTAEQIQDLEEKCARYGTKGKADLVIVTTDGSDGIDCEVYLENMYDELGFGYDKAFGDTVMIIVDMGTREVCIEGYGLAETRVRQSRGDYIREKITPMLSAGRYYEAFCRFTELSAKCMRLKGSLNPDSPLLSLPLQLLVALGIGAAVVGSMAYHSKGRMTVTGQTYLDRAKSNMLIHQDDYIRTTTTRTKRQTDSGSGGGGHSGGGGGTSSGGHSHSTSRGSF